MLSFRDGLMKGGIRDEEKKMEDVAAGGQLYSGGLPGRENCGDDSSTECS